ncbi:MULTISPECIES: hypothetical protein [Flavobacterium]|uniref:Uncharacterized protein n=1 Tax=Flavobacterium hankyongi TaxID=1176532 RepID=A0ABP8ZQY2_9FLAO|nr:hypothetical protein [Flavobacterium sp. N1846]
MKILKCVIFSIIYCCYSCSSEDQEAGDGGSGFEISLNSSTTNPSIDEEFTVNVTTNETTQAVWVSLDNFTTGGYTVQNLDNNFNLRFNFDQLGQKTIYIRCKNANGSVAEKHLNINIQRGNAIKINGLQVISFYNVNSSYDPEYPNTNPNHLADLQFGFAKSKLGDFLNSTYSYRRWFLSPIIENQGTMTWDVSGQNLFINPSKSLLFTLADIDDNIAGADLLNGPPDYRILSFSNYTTTKPNSITYSYPEINLEIKLNIEWAN